MLRPARLSATLVLGWLAYLGLSLEATAAEGTLPDQILVLRAPRKTRVELAHVDGDRVAELKITHPPSGAAETLRAQAGSFVTAVEHVLFERDVLTLLLRLSTDAVEVATRRLSRPSGWSVMLTPRREPPFPPASRLVGYLPGLLPPPPRPVLFPAAPRDTPCTGHRDGEIAINGISGSPILSEVGLEERVRLVTDPLCRSWAVAQLAVNALEEGRDLTPFERWAFLFAFEADPWSLHRGAFALVSLVAAEVLSRQGYVPESERLLADARRYTEAHAPFRAMALANHFAILRDHDEAETLYRQLVAEGFDPWMIYQASLARALNALEGGDSRGALAHAERGARLLPEPEDLPGDLFVVGGEAALANGELALAAEHYRRAAKGRSTSARAMGLLRLADLDLRAERSESALKGWLLAGAVGSACVRDHVHLRRVLVLEQDRAEIMRFLSSQADFSRCEAVQMEAQFARAMTHLARGEEALALEPAVQIAENGISRWGPARPHRALVSEVGRSAVARWRRHRDPATLVTFFEAHLERFSHLLDHRTRFWVGRAYDAIGASARAAEELLGLLTEEPEVAFREELLLALGEAFLRSGDTYRTDLVLRHLATRYPSTELRWRQGWLAGRHHLRLERPKSALEHLDLARRLAPLGDKRAEVALDRSRALLAMGEIEAAGRALLDAAESPLLPDSAIRAPAIEALSECARSCRARTLSALTEPLVERVGRETLSSRLVERLVRRGALEKDKARPEDAPSDRASTLFGRLHALGVNSLDPASGPDLENP